MNEYKILMKNCFHHIKELPELFYELFGDQLSSISPDKAPAVDQNLADNSRSVPNCIKCYNSEWKTHMIVEKNISIQSVLKVGEELVR